MTHDQSVAALYETASEWFTRQQDLAHWSEQDQAAFTHWLQADPRHQHAYEEIATTWQLFEHIPRPAPLTATDTPQHSSISQPRRTARSSRLSRWTHHLLWPVRSTLGAALSLSVILGMAGWYWYCCVPEFSEHIQTVRAEQRELTLPDGTVVTVNIDSDLRVAFYPQQREVLLVQGEAFFAVAPQGDHHFIVKAANTQVRVVGTAFNVRATPSTIYIAVNEGVVQVSSQGNRQDHNTTLQAGDTLTINTQTGVQQPASIAPELAGSWISGQLSFKNTPLHEVIETLQPYTDKPITLSNPQTLGQYKVSGFANTQNPIGFLNALTQLLPVKVHVSEHNGYVVAPK